ncbi:hypothetical protein ACOMHN_044030 [Nucella lapillus]
MAKTKHSKKRTAQKDEKLDDTKAAAGVLNGDIAKTEDIAASIRLERPDVKDCQKSPSSQKGLLEAGEETTNKSSAVRSKRKLRKTQTLEGDSHESKRRRTDSTFTSKVSSSKSYSKKSSQNTKESHSYKLRCRTKPDSQEQSSTLSSSADLKKTGKPSSKPGKKATKKSKGSDDNQATSPAVVSGAAVKTDSETEVKTESKAEVASATTGARKLVGAHCSIVGGLYKAVEEAVAMGGRAFGLFLRSQRSWTSKPLDPKAADKFKASCKEHGFPPSSILPHGSYLMNCGSPNPDTLKKSREALLEELQRCEALGLTLYNFHPGSTCGEISVEECLEKIADAINWAHQHTKFVITVVENMSCQGNTVGGRFEELKGIIDRVKDKSRIGICLDTCHAFAAGYDLSSAEGFEKFVSEFDSLIGFQYLKAMHLNDSKGAVGCHLDRHENIGKGQIGLEGFRRVMTEPRFNGIPMILETPLGDYAKEIDILNKLTTG